MDERWWPGLRRQVTAVDEARRQDVLVRRADPGRHAPLWLVARSTTPWWVNAGVGVGTVAGLAAILAVTGVRGWSLVAVPVAGSILAGVLVDGWYALGARRLRRGDAGDGPTPSVPPGGPGAGPP